MGLYDNELKSRLIRFLERKSMPRRFDGKPEAMQDEIEALLVAISRQAPQGSKQIAEWWPAFSATLSELCGAPWPTEKEIAEAGRQHRRAVRFENAGTDMTPVAIAARQMERGESVGEHFLYGSGAVEILARGLVAEDVIKNYRSAWFRGLVEVYGVGKAHEKEAEAQARHRAAEGNWTHRNDQKKPHAVKIPTAGRVAPQPFEQPSNVKTEGQMRYPAEAGQDNAA